jgi:hypothetical protein
MSYWIFKCDPKKYRLGERLAELPNPATTWLVTRYKKEIAPGDTAFLMETGPKRAIRAVMRVDSSPSNMAELSHEQDYWAERDTEIRCRVLGTLTHRVHVLVDEIKEVEALKDLSIFKGFQQGTNFRVSEEEGRVLIEFVRDYVESIADIQEGIENEAAGRTQSIVDVDAETRSRLGDDVPELRRRDSE